MDATKIYPDRILGESVYIDFNTEFNLWDVVGNKSGHVYCQHYCKDCAEDDVKERNKRAVDTYSVDF